MVKTVKQQDDVQAKGDALADAQIETKGEALAMGAAPAVARFARVKSVAVPLFKMIPGVPRFFLIDAPMYVGKKIDEKKEAATLCNATDLETGETGQIIIGAVLKSLFNESYPSNTYVGKKYEICVRKNADKKYNSYDVYEIAGK